MNKGLLIVAGLLSVGMLASGEALANDADWNITIGSQQWGPNTVQLAEEGGVQIALEGVLPDNGVWQVTDVRIGRGSYTGLVRDGIREGSGKMIYTNGGIYEGDWKDGWREGHGKMIYNYGDIYEGGWKNDKREGYGKYIYFDGDIYEGDWKDGKWEGHGKYIYNNGDVCEGDWENDLLVRRNNNQ